MKKHFFFAAFALLGASLLQAAVNPATFSKITDPVKDGSLPTAGITSAVTIFGDYNNDGLLDIFYVGGENVYNTHIGLLKNNGNGQWEPVALPTDATPLAQASAVWIDYNNDGNLDLIVSGLSADNTATMYALKNAGGDDGFAIDATCTFGWGVYHENNNIQSMSVIDYNNDGWMDFVITGTPSGWDMCYDWRCTAIYINQKGYFSKDQKYTSFNKRNGNVFVCDANSDGLFDVFNTGYGDNGLGYGANGHLNTGDGFSDFSGVTFVASQLGAAFSVDVNNDGLQDIIQITRDPANNWSSYAAVWLYDGTTWSQKQDCGITGGDAVVSVGDVNNDGYMDIFYSGYPNVRLAYGNGDGTFTEYAFTGDLAELGSRNGMVNLVDIDGDNLLDIQANGYNDTKGGYCNALAKNVSTDMTNEAPTAPANLTITATDKGYKLTWDAGTDDKTPEKALRYNVMATTDDNKVFAINPADLKTGKQKVAGGYIAYLNTLSYEMYSKEFTTFYVQTIDGANVGSEFVSKKVDQTPTAYDEVSAAPTAKKIIRNGQMFILKDGSYYNALGISVN